MTQDNQSPSIYYIHDKPESFLSKISKLALWLSGSKKAIEKDMTSGKIDQKAAPVPKSMSTNFHIDLEEFNGRKVWTVIPKQNGSDKVILYLHGGAYIYNIFKEHWQLIVQLLERTGATIVVPDYPLAPKSNCTEVFTIKTVVSQE